MVGRPAQVATDLIPVTWLLLIGSQRWFQLTHVQNSAEKLVTPFYKYEGRDSK